MQLQLNIQESSIRKKRGISFFDGKNGEKLDQLNQTCEEVYDFSNQKQQQSARNKSFKKSDTVQMVKISKVVEDMKKQNIRSPGVGTGLEEAMSQQYTKCSPMNNEQSQQMIDTSVPSFIKQKQVIKKSSTEKEIVSAMVRLNNQGLKVPLNFEEMKNLPIIPNTGARIKKKNFTDLGPHNNFMSLKEENEDEEYTEQEFDPEGRPMSRISHSSQNLKQRSGNTTLDEDSTTVFDLVHRGRQRQQYFKNLQNQGGKKIPVASPKILSPASVDHRHKSIRRLLKQNAMNALDLNQSLSSSHLLGRKDLTHKTQCSRSQCANKYIENQNKKKLIRNLHNEIQSAVLPEIEQAITKWKSNSVNSRKPKYQSTQTQSKKIEYIHEEIYDQEKNTKWTIFNKHAIVLENSPEQPSPRGPQGETSYLLEDSIIEKMHMDELPNKHVFNVSTIPESTWIQLYEAKCHDLGIPYLQDKQQERFVSQMMLNQSNDKISFKEQAMSQNCAVIIGKKIIANNENLVKIDLSNNMLQKNFKSIVQGLKKNSRIIQITMKNNELSGHEHAEEIKKIVKNHPSLSILDFSNSELNVKKNKLRNQGVNAIVEGILESTEQGCSLISEINLSHNCLTSDCLPIFAQLSDPDWIQLQNLNLSNNDLGSDTISILRPILGSVLTLNLANTKLNNQSMEDFKESFRIQEMKLQEFNIHNNLITTEGCYTLLVCLKTNNKVKQLNISKNQIAIDIKLFKQIQKFLNCNKVLEVLNMGNCNIGEKAGQMVGKGLRGNRNLQVLILKDNPIKEGVIEIAKSFVGNKNALCIKELDLSKCQINCDHITTEFIDMIKSKWTTLKTLNLRDNLLRNRAGGLIKDALEVNKKITKVNLDYNQIKQQIVQKIDELCLRNHHLDLINRKNKNIYQFKKDNKEKQKKALKKEISDLQYQTDKSITEAQSTIDQFNRFKRQRKSAQIPSNASNTIQSNYTKIPCQQHGDFLQIPSAVTRVTPDNFSHLNSQTGLNISFGTGIMVKEPQTSLTKNTIGTSFSFNGSVVQHSRHKSQGPMRSEKVYMMTQMMQEKATELNTEQNFIKDQYKFYDENNDRLKERIIQETQDIRDELAFEEQRLQDKEDELKYLDEYEKELIKNHEKQVQDVKDHITALKLGQEKIMVDLKVARKELNKEISKYDKFLVGDRERTMYANDSVKTRRMIYQSYLHERDRLQQQVDAKVARENENNTEAMELGRREYRRIETQSFKSKKIKGTSQALQRNNTVKDKDYKKVKSRLFRSIESSRKKENAKYYNDELRKRMEFKDQKKPKTQDKENNPNDQNRKNTPTRPAAGEQSKAISYASRLLSFSRANNSNTKNQGSMGTSMEGFNKAQERETPFVTKLGTSQNKHVSITEHKDIVYKNISNPFVENVNASNVKSNENINDRKTVVFQNNGQQVSNGGNSNSLERYHIEQSAYQNLSEKDNEKDPSKSGGQLNLPLEGMGAGIGGLNMMNIMAGKIEKDMKPKPEGILKKNSVVVSKKESPNVVE